MPDNMKDVMENVMDALEVLEQDKTVVDALNTVGALTLSPGKYWALSMFNVEAAKRIEKLIPSKQ